MKSSTTPSEPYIGFLGFMLMLAKNPFNHVGMTQKVPYIPILVGLGPKLWSVTLKLCQRAKLSVPLCLAVCTEWVLNDANNPPPVSVFEKSLNQIDSQLVF